MSSIDVNHVLSQIRTMQAQIRDRPTAPTVAEAAPAGGFSSVLKNAVEQVNAAQHETARLQHAFAMGDKNTDLSAVMVASAQSQVQFKAVVEVRNRLVAAYQDIMNMPV